MQEIYIVAAKRTPFGRYHKQLADFTAVELGEIALRGALAEADLDAESLDALFMGNVLAAGLGQNMARQVAINSGMRQDSVATSINEVCGSSLKAVRLAEAQMLIGDLGLVAVGGSESMSNSPKELMMTDGLVDSFSGQAMGVTAENVAKRNHVSREAQDEYSLKSHQKAVKAWEEGLFDDEVIVIEKGEEKIAKDENVRPDTSMEALGGLKTVFEENGTVTAGNASPVTDGASMVILATKEKVDEYGLKPLAKLGAYAETGYDPEFMGYGPYVAIQKLLAKTGRTKDDYDFFEINEAFAATSLAVMRDLGLNEDKVNQQGGAIALGHPLGASGTRLVATSARQVARGAKRGIASLCIGGGLAIAMEIEKA